MSDEEIYIDDDSDEGVGEEEEFMQMEQIDDSPEGIYEQAKGNVGFQNELAVKLFQEVINNEDAEMHLRAKASYNCLPLLASSDDLETLKTTFQFFYDQVNAEEINQSHFERTMDSIFVNILHSEQIVRNFLAFASTILDPNKPAHQNIALDTRLRLIEVEIKYANYPLVDQLIPDTAAFIPDVPNPNNTTLVRLAGRLMIIQIEMALMRNQDDIIEDLYQKVMKLQNISWTPKQQAVLKFVQGKDYMKAHNYASAKATFAEAFKGFNETGSDRRTEVIAYWTLAAMLCHDQADIFASGEVLQFKVHPLVAPLHQLHECYMKNDIVHFKLKLDEAKKIFHSPLYDQLLAEVEHYVLKNSLALFCTNYTSIEISYLAKRVMGESELKEFNSLPEDKKQIELQRRATEIKDIVIELILARRLDATIDLVRGVVVTHQTKESLFLDSVTPLIDVMDKLSIQFLERSKIAPYKIEIPIINRFK